MSKEELLRPRYKVVADYPRSMFTIGQILRPRGGDKWFYSDNDDLIKYPEKYPTIFQPLPWYAERSESDLPEYVRSKTDNVIVRVVDYRYLIGEIAEVQNIDDNFKYAISMCDYLPADESEYLAQLSLNQE